MKRFVLLMLVVFSCFLGAGCRASERDGLRIVCTIFPPYDFARAVTQGTNADVTMLVKPGVESHAFDPTPQDVVRIQSADLFVYIGGENDVWVDRVLDSLGESQPTTLRLMDSVDVLNEESLPGLDAPAEQEPDQHIWTSPVNAKRMLNALSDALCRIAPDQAAQYQANTAAYGQKLDELDNAFRAVVEGGKRREMIFADRFPFLYFAKAYGLTCYAAFPGCSAESEPSAATVAFLIDRIKADGIPAVYHLEQGNQKTADVIAAETGAQSLLFHACHNISKTDFDAGKTYVDFMRANVEALRIGLS